VPPVALCLTRPNPVRRLRQEEAIQAHQRSPPGAAEGIRAQGAPPDYPASQAYAACLIAQRCLEEAGAADESLWRAACALDCGTFFGRFRIDPATGLQVGHEMVLVQWQRGRKLVVWPPSVSKARPLYPSPLPQGGAGRGLPSARTGSARSQARTGNFRPRERRSG
jgi:hypothetical protein